MKYPRDWEIVSGNTSRLKVPGGWWIKEIVVYHVADKVSACAIELRFFLDPEYEWDLK